MGADDGGDDDGPGRAQTPPWVDLRRAELEQAQALPAPPWAPDGPPAFRGPPALPAAPPGFPGPLAPVERPPADLSVHDRPAPAPEVDVPYDPYAGLFELTDEERAARKRRRRFVGMSLLGVAAALVAVVLALVHAVPAAVDAVRGGLRPASDSGTAPLARPRAATPTPSVSPTATPRPRRPAAQPVVWPLPASCARDATDERRVTASDRRQLGRDGIVVASYRVGEGRLGSLRSGSRQRCHDLAWRVVRQVYPPQALALIDRFVVFETPPRGSARSEKSLANTLAFVSTTDPGFRRWTLAVALEGQGQRQFARTVVHELGHLLSLGAAQMDVAGGRPAKCRTYKANGTCTKRNSPLDSFVRTAWTPKMLGEAAAVARATSPRAKERAFVQFYLRYRNRFVSPYASTDPTEDFAETFSYWCLGRTATSPPFTTSALLAKSRFFSARRDLAGMRSRCAALR